MPGAVSKDKATGGSHPFGLPWLDSCYQETLLPEGSWRKVRAIQLRAHSEHASDTMNVVVFKGAL